MQVAHRIFNTNLASECFFDTLIFAKKIWSHWQVWKQPSASYR